MNQRVFVVVGAKGGVGATTIAVKLVEELPARGERVIVDADLAGKRSHAVWFDVVSDLDLGRASGTVGTAKSTSGPIVMELARSYEDGFVQTADSVFSSIERLPENALIVVDAPQPFAAIVRPLIARAAKIIVVTEPTLLGIGAARTMLSAMDRFGISPARIAFVLNEARVNSELRRSEIQAALGTPVSVEIPKQSDRAFRKIFAGFVEMLAAAPEFQTLESLRQSSAKPIGDRRGSSRVEPQVRAIASTAEAAPDPRAVSASTAATDKLKTELHAMMLKRIDFLTAARADTDAEKLAELRAQVDGIAAEFIAGRNDITSAEQASRIRREVIEEALGLGPLESLLQEDGITEIMVNGHGHVFVERHGRIETTTKQFVDDRQVRLVIERIIAPLGRRLDESSPMVDARLPDGSRVNAVIEPLAIDGPALTIRRFGTKRLGIDDLVSLGAITPPIVDFLRAAVEARLNIVVSGGTGSGKTTLLNSLSSFIPRDERIVTIEDAAEIQLDQPHVVRLESRPPNLEGKGAITIRDLVRNSLRMRPDRIVVGECRSGEALDMLQAMNTGHDGSLTTIHANSTRDAMARVETMVLMAGYDLPVRAIREQIAGAIDLIVQVARLRDGSRRVIGVSEIIGMEGDVVTMQELVKYTRHGVNADGSVIGEFAATGVQPSCLLRFEEMGVNFDPVMFGTAPKRRAELAWLR
jgi:pilus assembly protein CpaF